MACVVVVVCVAVVAGSLPVARRQSLVACCQFNHAKEHGRSNATNELPHTQLNSNSRGNSNIDNNNNTQGYFINVIAAMLRWSASTRLCGNCSIILKLITCQDSRAPRRTTTATYNNNDKAVADDNRIVVWGPDSLGQAGPGRAGPGLLELPALRRADELKSAAAFRFIGLK